MCAACPNSNIIVTAGSSTVVCVWDVSLTKDKLNYMKLRQVRHPVIHKNMLIPRNDGGVTRVLYLIFSYYYHSLGKKKKTYTGWI